VEQSTSAPDGELERGDPFRLVRAPAPVACPPDAKPWFGDLAGDVGHRGFANGVSWRDHPLLQAASS
jgi:hypothetical protein